MSNLSEKFDQLPQDFDREAIWEGIEKPTRFALLRPYVLGGLFIIASLAVVLALTVGPVVDTDAIGQVSAVSADSPDQVEEEGILQRAATQDADPNSSLVSADAQQAADERDTDRFEDGAFTINSNKDKGRSTRSTEDKATGTIAETPISNKRNGAEARRADRKDDSGDAENVLEDNDDVRAYFDVSRVPSELTFLEETPEVIHLGSPDRIEVAKGRTSRHNLALRASFGSHFSNFDSSDPEAVQWRSDLEKAQLDYGLGLRYEYFLKHDFYLALSAGYQLFKDKINTSFIREIGDEEVRVDYDLHNHYHVFTGQLEAGKRFYQKAFFWDVNAGIGLKFYQASETDFFIGEDKLADDALVESEYANATDVFFTGQAAIGRNLTSRLYLRLGAQVSSRMELTSSEAENRHLILPVNAFLELGMRL